MAITQSISQAKELGMWLHEHTNEKEVPAGLREQTGLSILQQSLDVDYAIIVLLEANLPGPALALARPLFESYVRGFWLLNYASNEEINEFLDGKCPTFPGLLIAIDKTAESGGAWIHANTSANLNSFHDLTHGGSKHVKRRMTLGAIEPHYDEQELVLLLKFGIEIRIRVGAALLALMKNEDALEQLNEKAKSYRATLA
jgi:hypothetical protein